MYMALNDIFLHTLQADDFHLGMLTSDAKRRRILDTVLPEDIDLLIERLQQVKPLIVDYREQKQSEAIKLIREAIASSTSFNTVEDVLAALNGTTEPVRNTTQTSSNKSYRIALYDSSTDTRREYTISNKILPPSLKKDPVYIALLKKNPELENVDEFLRAYSTQYALEFPINAKWDGKEFYLNLRGKLNNKAEGFYQEYKKENPTGDLSEFKELVQKAYKNA